MHSHTFPQLFYWSVRGWHTFSILYLLADVHFTRYMFVWTAFVLAILGCSVFALIILANNLLTHGEYLELYAALGIFLMTYLFALGMFEATAVQFGMDQMLEDSSDQLSTFIQWYYWGSKLGRFLLAILITGFAIYFSHCQFTDTNSVFYDILVGSTEVGLGQLTLHIWTLPVGLLQKHLNIDQIGNSPCKLVYQSLKYASHHKCPERRSAFTY